MIRRSMRPLLALALCSALFASGLTSQAIGQGVVMLHEDMSRCAIFRALSADVPPDCRSSAKTIMFPSVQTVANRLYAFATTRIQFTFDSSQLTPESQYVLDRLAEGLKDAHMADKVVRIEGHTDSVGAAAYNQRLSYRRAMAVQHYLHAHHGMALRRLPALGKGEDEPYDPVSPTTAVNRRVQFVNLSDHGGRG